MKIILLRKRHKRMLEDAAALRAQQAGFKKREAEVTARVEAARAALSCVMPPSQM